MDAEGPFGTRQEARSALFGFVGVGIIASAFVQQSATSHRPTRNNSPPRRPQPVSTKMGDGHGRTTSNPLINEVRPRYPLRCRLFLKRALLQAPGRGELPRSAA